MNSRLRTNCSYVRGLVVDWTSHSWFQWIRGSRYKTTIQSGTILSFYNQQKYYVYKRRIFYRTCKTIRMWHYCDSNVTRSHIRHVVITLLGTEEYSVGMVSKSTGWNLLYVYWTVHHLDSWIKINQLDVTCFIISLFTAQHVSNVSTSILRSLRLICWVI